MGNRRVDTLALDRVKRAVEHATSSKDIAQAAGISNYRNLSTWLSKRGLRLVKRNGKYNLVNILDLEWKI